MSSRFLPFVALVTLLPLSGCLQNTTTLPAPTASAQPASEPSLPAYSVLAWNLNSGVPRGGEGTDGDIEQAIELMAAQPASDIYAFSEVFPAWEQPLVEAFEARGDFEVRLSETGRSQRLALGWNNARFEALEVNELGRVNVDGRGRSPLAALLQDRETAARFMVIAVHLRSGSAEARAEESAILRDLVAELEYPTIVVGDFNYRCPSDGTAPADCDPAFDTFVQGGLMQWLSPVNPAPSMCRSRWTTMLDMAFIANADAGDSELQMLPTTWCDGMGSGAHTPIAVDVRWRAARVD